MVEMINQTIPLNWMPGGGLKKQFVFPSWQSSPRRV